MLDRHGTIYPSVWNLCKDLLMDSETYKEYRLTLKTLRREMKELHAVAGKENTQNLMKGRMTYDKMPYETIYYKEWIWELRRNIRSWRRQLRPDPPEIDSYPRRVWRQICKKMELSPGDKEKLSLSIAPRNAPRMEISLHDRGIVKRWREGRLTYADFVGKDKLCQFIVLKESPAKCELHKLSHCLVYNTKYNRVSKKWIAWTFDGRCFPCTNKKTAIDMATRHITTAVHSAIAG